MEYWQAGIYCQPRWRSAVDGWLRNVQSTIWPATCVLCRARAESGRDLCTACEADLILNTSACARCAHPLQQAVAAAVQCGACLRGPPAFDSSFIPYRYAYPLDRMIQRLKYANELSVGRVLGELLSARLRAARRDELPQVLVPVPLAVRRFHSRGFNQAIEVARVVARASGVPLALNIVARVRETQEQAGQPRKRRRRNVRGAFKALSQSPPQHVAIVDDVVTTGSTVNELARVLRRAGVQRVEVWALARAARSLR